MFCYFCQQRRNLQHDVVGRRAETKCQLKLISAIINNVDNRLISVGHEVSLFLLFYIIINGMFLHFGLLVRQNKQLQDAILASSQFSEIF